MREKGPLLRSLSLCPAEGFPPGPDFKVVLPDAKIHAGERAAAGYGDLPPLSPDGECLPVQRRRGQQEGLHSPDEPLRRRTGIGGNLLPSNSDI